MKHDLERRNMAMGNAAKICPNEATAELEDMALQLEASGGVYRGSRRLRPSRITMAARTRFAVRSYPRYGNNWNGRS